ncbi:MAG TPA: HD domain-containing phosphohydrolase, partial [Candidatus Omnitrophota bacterium]|nr:HD domain-containing phosphohydrolase [Candidatus Omnitrophota bacterium]
MRTAVDAVMVGQSMGMTAEELKTLYVVSRFHDMGKGHISISTAPEGAVSILEKADGLTDAEYRVMKSHAEYGTDIMRQIPASVYEQAGIDKETVVEGVSKYHENPDGTGYPMGSKDAEISKFSAILHAVDALDAMMRVRPYQPRPRTASQAAAEFKKNRGTKFSWQATDHVVSTFLSGARLAHPRGLKSHERLTQDNYTIGGEYLLTDGLSVFDLGVTGTGVNAQGEAFIIDPDKFYLVQRWHEPMRVKDIGLPYRLKKNEMFAGFTVDDYVDNENRHRSPIMRSIGPDLEADRDSVALAVNSTQGHFLDPNTLLIVNGRMVMKPIGIRGLNQKRYQYPDGKYWVLGLDPSRRGVHTLEIKKGVLKGEVPIENGFAGPPIILNGKSTLNLIKFTNNKPNVSGNEVNWPDADKRMSMTGFGYDRQGNLVIVQLIGNPNDKAKPEPTVKNLIETMLRFDVQNAVLGGTSGDVQRYTRHDVDEPLRYAQGRIDPKTGEPSGLQGPLGKEGTNPIQRRVGTALLIYERPSLNDPAGARLADTSALSFDWSRNMQTQVLADKILSQIYAPDAREAAIREIIEEAMLTTINFEIVLSAVLKKLVLAPAWDRWAVDAMLEAVRRIAARSADDLLASEDAVKAEAARRRLYRLAYMDHHPIKFRSAWGSDPLPQAQHALIKPRLRQAHEVMRGVVEGVLNDPASSAKPGYAALRSLSQILDEKRALNRYVVHETAVKNFKRIKEHGLSVDHLDKTTAENPDHIFFHDWTKLSAITDPGSGKFLIRVRKNAPTIHETRIPDWDYGDEASDFLGSNIPAEYLEVVDTLHPWKAYPISQVGSIETFLKTRSAQGARLSASPKEKILEKIKELESKRKPPVSILSDKDYKYIDVIRGAERIFPIPDVHADIRALVYFLTRVGLVRGNFEKIDDVTADFIQQVLKDPDGYLLIRQGDVIPFLGDLVDTHLPSGHEGLTAKRKEIYGSSRPNVDTLRLVHLMKETAEKRGAKVVVLLGNHDHVTKVFLDEMQKVEAPTLDWVIERAQRLAEENRFQPFFFKDVAQTAVEIFSAYYRQGGARSWIQKVFDDMKFIAVVDNNVFTHAQIYYAEHAKTLEEYEKEIRAVLEGEHPLDMWREMDYAHFWMSQQTDQELISLAEQKLIPTVVDLAKIDQDHRNFFYGLTRKALDLPDQTPMRIFVGHDVRAKAVVRGSTAAGEEPRPENDDVFRLDAGLSYYYRQYGRPGLAVLRAVEGGIFVVEKDRISNLAYEDESAQDLLASENSRIARRIAKYRAELIAIEKSSEDRIWMHAALRFLKKRAPIADNFREKIFEETFLMEYPQVIQTIVERYRNQSDVYSRSRERKAAGLIEKIVEEIGKGDGYTIEEFREKIEAEKADWVAQERAHLESGDTLDFDVIFEHDVCDVALKLAEHRKLKAAEPPAGETQGARLAVKPLNVDEWRVRWEPNQVAIRVTEGGTIDPATLRLTSPYRERLEAAISLISESHGYYPAAFSKETDKGPYSAELRRAAPEGVLATDHPLNRLARVVNDLPRPWVVERNKDSLIATLKDDARELHIWVYSNGIWWIGFITHDNTIQNPVLEVSGSLEGVTISGKDWEPVGLDDPNALYAIKWHADRKMLDIVFEDSAQKKIEMAKDRSYMVRANHFTFGWSMGLPRSGWERLKPSGARLAGPSERFDIKKMMLASGLTAVLGAAGVVSSLYFQRKAPAEGAEKVETALSEKEAIRRTTVDDEALRTYHAIIQSYERAFDAYGTALFGADRRADVVSFRLAIGKIESGLRARVQRGGGPALAHEQIEPETIKTVIVRALRGEGGAMRNVLLAGLDQAGQASMNTLYRDIVAERTSGKTNATTTQRIQQLVTSDASFTDKIVHLNLHQESGRLGRAVPRRDEAAAMTDTYLAMWRPGQFIRPRIGLKVWTFHPLYTSSETILRDQDRLALDLAARIHFSDRLDAVYADLQSARNRVRAKSPNWTTAAGLMRSAAQRLGAIESELGAYPETIRPELQRMVLEARGQIQNDSAAIEKKTVPSGARLAQDTSPEEEKLPRPDELMRELVGVMTEQISSRVDEPPLSIEAKIDNELRPNFQKILLQRAEQDAFALIFYVEFKELEETLGQKIIALDKELGPVIENAKVQARKSKKLEVPPAIVSQIQEINLRLGSARRLRAFTQEMIGRMDALRSGARLAGATLPDLASFKFSDFMGARLSTSFIGTAEAAQGIPTSDPAGIRMIIRGLLSPKTPKEGLLDVVPFKFGPGNALISAKLSKDKKSGEITFYDLSRIDEKGNTVVFYRIVITEEMIERVKKMPESAAPALAQEAARQSDALQAHLEDQRTTQFARQMYSKAKIDPSIPVVLRFVTKEPIRAEKAILYSEQMKALRSFAGQNVFLQFVTLAADGSVASYGPSDAIPANRKD